MIKNETFKGSNVVTSPYCITSSRNGTGRVFVYNLPRTYSMAQMCRFTDIIAMVRSLKLS